MKRLLSGMITLVFAVAITLTTAGCAPLTAPPAPGPAPAPTPSPATPGQALTGTIELRVTDAPPRDEVTSILVKVASVQIHRATAEELKAGTANVTQPVEGVEEQGETSGWQSLNITGANPFDLLKIKGLEEVLGTSQLAAGKYTQIRMVIDKVQVALGGNAPQDATVPSGALKFVRPFDVVAGQTVTLLLDFDADKSVNVTGGGKVMVKPVVKLSVKPGPKGPPQAGKAPTQTDSQQLAEEFVRNNSTFAYDGIPDSLKLADNLTAAQPPSTWIFTFDFQSRHAGYGNRTGQVLAEVITPHRAVVTVEQGKIKSAVIDGKWDMLKEKMLS